MAKMTIFFFSFLLVFLLIRNCESRYLQSNSSLQSDGVDYNIDDQSPLQLFRGGLETQGDCSHLYGFLPCSENIPGHVFQIVVYEYLLFLGECYVSLGSQIVFTILGTGLFGASAFHILGALPEGMIVIVSGFSKTKELAQASVMTGVGMVAGSTTFLLTLLWGTCLIFGTRKFSIESKSKDSETQILDNSRYKRHLSYITGSGITIDTETNFSSRILFISLVPIIILQIPRLVTILYSSGRIIILISLIISALSLLSYFFYQIFYPRIQTRKLEFVKNEHLMEDFLKHVKRRASGMLLTDEGVPNFPVIRRLFRNIDYNKDAGLTEPEVEKIIETEKLEEEGIVAVMKELDIDQNQKISEEEFVNVFTKWLLKNKLANKASYSKTTMDQIYEPRVENYLRSKQLVSEISEHLRNNAIGSLITDDGKPNLQVVKRLFENFDHDGDKYVSPGELTKAIQGIQSEKTDLQGDEVITHLMKELDRNEDQLINEDEFVDGFSKLLGSKMTPDDVYLEAWEATEKVMNKKATRGPNVDSHLRDWAKAIWFLSVGTLMLSLLAEPLVASVTEFSNGVGIPSFFVTFVLLPLATNYRKARSAIRSASDSKARTTSLAFSEIYSSAFINNLFGLSLFLAIVYGRGLAWEFTAEMLIIVVVCVVMGGIGCLGKIPAWTCVVAYLLYPFSLAFVYVLNVVFGWA